ncbi:MAG TPA: Uma2 family endonuclease [Nostocaceae cyanobacterium]|nr:Uma2 family endonuclease [Nostocaceae cyanobacterium]
MTNQNLNQNDILPEQRFLLPGYYTWEDLEKIDELISKVAKLRITYLDGLIEFMTVGEQHELIKSILAILIETYFFEKRINFIPVGRATRRDQNKEVSFEPDESYYIGTKKENPDLAIEVNFTSGSINKLEKYKRVQIKEVWFWEDNQLFLYHLKNGEYLQITQSELLPDLNIDLLVRCVLMSSVVEAREEFIKQI